MNVFYFILLWLVLGVVVVLLNYCCCRVSDGRAVERQRKDVQDNEAEEGLLLDVSPHRRAGDRVGVGSFKRFYRALDVRCRFVAAERHLPVA
jgi:hypothetical protein